jgi:hypothetical protein|tara:strand:- start:2166 stop:2630 length:465 start_codon:yes stop_codon:yes gene_type:complete
MLILANLSNQTYSSPKPILDTKLLLCSLFTLLPTGELFQELNCTNSPVSTCLNSELFLTESWYVNNFSLLINKPLVRQLAYTILQPLIHAKNKKGSKQRNEKSIEEQTLKKYLKKFKYFYKLFFFDDSLSSKPLITDREINFLAIKFLFLLIGI